MDIKIKNHKQTVVNQSASFELNSLNFLSIPRILSFKIIKLFIIIIILKN